jgi:hypothetical protein
MLELNRSHPGLTYLVQRHKARQYRTLKHGPRFDLEEFRTFNQAAGWLVSMGGGKILVVATSVAGARAYLGDDSAAQDLVDEDHVLVVGVYRVASEELPYTGPSFSRRQLR